MQLSIIIPIHNEILYIPKSFESIILAGSQIESEFFFVDGQSNDGTYDVITFETIGGLGFYTAVAPQSYQILQQNNTTMYIRNVGSEGNSWYSMFTTDPHALSTNDNEILDMMVYPNPVDGNYVTIVTPVQGSKEIQVFTVTGRKVMDTVINGNTLDVSSFNSGFYMLKVTVDGQSKISKLVVR